MNDTPQTPSRRDRMRPLELLVMAAVLGVFVGAFAFMGTREWALALIMAGVAFIVALVIIATLLIAVTPKNADRVDPVDPDAPTGAAGSVHRDPRSGPREH